MRWACSGAVAAPYGVPAASDGDIVAGAVDLIVTRLAARKSREVIGRRDLGPTAAVVHVELSSSAMKASLNALSEPTRVLLREEAEVE